MFHTYLVKPYMDGLGHMAESSVYSPSSPVTIATIYTLALLFS